MTDTYRAAVISAALSPAQWARLARQISEEIAGVHLHCFGRMLTVITSPQDRARVDQGLLNAVLALGVQDEVNLLLDMSEEPPTVPSIDRGAGSLIAAELTLAPAEGNRHRLAFMQLAMQVFEPSHMILQMNVVAAELATIAAVAGVPITTDTVAAAAEACGSAGEWKLLLPGLCEAVVSGKPGSAFEQGERLDVGLTVDAQLFLCRGLINMLAAQWQAHPTEVALSLLTR